MRRFKKGDIVTFKDDDKDYEVICADDEVAVLAHTYLRLNETKTTDYEDLYVYSNVTTIPMQDYEVIFKA